MVFLFEPSLTLKMSMVLQKYSKVYIIFYVQNGRLTVTMVGVIKCDKFFVSPYRARKDHHIVHFMIFLFRLVILGNEWRYRNVGKPSATCTFLFVT